MNHSNSHCHQPNLTMNHSHSQMNSHMDWLKIDWFGLPLAHIMNVIIKFLFTHLDVIVVRFSTLLENICSRKKRRIPDFFFCFHLENLIIFNVASFCFSIFWFLKLTTFILSWGWTHPIYLCVWCVCAILFLDRSRNLSDVCVQCQKSKTLCRTNNTPLLSQINLFGFFLLFAVFFLTIIYNLYFKMWNCPFSFGNSEFWL